MTSLSLRDAARETGVSKSTIFRAIQKGRLSATRTDDGGFAIDPSELFRVYPPAQRGGDSAAGQDATPTQPSPNGEAELLRARLDMAETELRTLRERLDEAREQAAEWRQQAQAVVRLLPTPQAAPESRGWRFWRRAAA